MLSTRHDTIRSCPYQWNFILLCNLALIQRLFSYTRFCYPPYPGVPWWASSSRTWSLSTISAREKMRRVTKEVWTCLERTDWGSKITLTIVHFFFFVIEACRVLVSLLICFRSCLSIIKAYKRCSLNFVMHNEHVSNVSSSGTASKKCGSSP